MPVRRKAKFTHREISILHEMRMNRDHEYTTHELSEILEMSWQTAHDTLARLFRRGYLQVKRKKLGGTIRWKLVTKRRRKKRTKR